MNKEVNNNTSPSPVKGNKTPLGKGNKTPVGKGKKRQVSTESPEEK